MKIVTIVGARPQFIKAASVSARLRKKIGVSEILVHTGQHYDDSMSGIFFDELEIPRPNYNLEVGGGSHGQNTGRMIEKIENVLFQEKPDWLLVYGDTDSTLAGAIAACKLDIPIAHVEAGLRSFNRRMPEEMNRILTDHASTHLFAPTQTAIDQLESEGISREDVTFSGDVMFDTAIHFGNIASQRSQILSLLDLSRKGYVLATIHRKENTDDAERLSGIMDGLSRVSCPVILPLHPRTRKKLIEFQIQTPSGVRLVDPVGYLDMALLEQAACVIATDSGGVQKEAFFHGVPCVTLRDETEWAELVAVGANCLAGAEPKKIGDFIESMMMTEVPSLNLYGEGDASAVIANFFELHA